MVAIKLGALVQDARGTLNGLVFSRCETGAVVRTKVVGTRPVSRACETVQRTVAGLASRWRNVLSGADRASWVAFAAQHLQAGAFGDSIRLNGLSVYLKVNTRLLLCGGSVRDAAPAKYSAPDLRYGPASIGWQPVGLAPFVVQASPAAVPAWLAFVSVARPQARQPVPAVADWRSVNVLASGALQFGADWSAAVAATFPGLGWDPARPLWLKVAAMDPSSGACSVPVLLQVALGARTWWGLSPWGTCNWGS